MNFCTVGHQRTLVCIILKISLIDIDADWSFTKTTYLANVSSGVIFPLSAGQTFTHFSWQVAFVNAVLKNGPGIKLLSGAVLRYGQVSHPSSCSPQTDECTHRALGGYLRASGGMPPAGEASSREGLQWLLSGVGCVCVRVFIFKQAKTIHQLNW